jgi:hypothetical protein
MGEGRDVYRVLVGRPEGQSPVGTPRRMWKSSLKMDLRDIGIDAENWILLARDRVLLLAFANTVMKLRVS